MIKINRHKAAITRYDYSKPIYTAIQHGIILKDNSVFDYGCGKGDDVYLLKKNGYSVSGWDPFHFTKLNKTKALIVNLGYVINVIEEIQERMAVLKDAFSYAEKCLIVSAQVLNEYQQSQGKSYNDGIITSRNTFQKYYTQIELHEFISNSLNVEPVPASLGIFYVFTDEKYREEFLADKYIRRYVNRPRKYKSIQEKLAPCKELLNEFADSVENLGRIPNNIEFKKYNEIKLNIGSVTKAVSYCEELFENFNYDKIVKNKKEDILVYLALSNIKGKLKQKNVNKILLNEIKFHFKNFTNALTIASGQLLKLRNHSKIHIACEKSPIGKILPDSLYVHTDYISELDPILKLFVGCATQFAGILSDSTLLKINRKKRKVSFLYYDNFDKDPHPKLLHSIVVDLNYFTIKDWDQSTENPPILHRKETFVGEDYLNYNKFQKLTKQEEKAGLFDTGRFIGRKKHWNDLLVEKGFCLKGHRLFKGSK